MPTPKQSQRFARTLLPTRFACILLCGCSHQPVAVPCAPLPTAPKALVEPTGLEYLLASPTPILSSRAPAPSPK